MRAGVLRLYVAGPMTGLPGFNYAAFHKAAKDLNARGHETINPARSEGREGCTHWIDFMRAALRDVANCDAICLLPGWHDSRGAALEAHIGQSLGLPVLTLNEWLKEEAA